MSSADWIEKDYYKVLGVAEKADAATIKKAYRKLAQQNHPDRNKNDKAAEERFKQISEAYGVIGDEKKRKEYDELKAAVAAGFVPGGGPGGPGGGFPGHQGGFPAGFQGGFSGDAGGFDLSDLFGGLFGDGARGRPQPPRAYRGVDLEAEVSIPFMEAVEGTTITLNVSVDGARGRGRSSRTITAKIPAGVRDGQRIRLKGKGGAGEHGGPAGDLIVTVNVGPHEVFGRDGDNLTIAVPIRIDEAVLGADISVPTLEGGSVRLRIPPGTPHGRTFRVRGRGVARPGGATGDLLVTVEVDVPAELSDEARTAVAAYREAMASTDPRSALFGSERRS